MSEQTFKGALAAILAIAWVVEVVSMRVMSPTLQLVANPIASRLGWRFVLIGILIPLVPFYNPVLGVLILGPGLLIAANNLDRLWLTRALGETRFRAVLDEAARAGRLKLAIVSFLGAGLLISCGGGALMVLSRGGNLDWSYWFGLGLVLYGPTVSLMRILFVLRLHKQSSASPSAG